MKIAMAGYGIEGKASFDYWNTPDNDLTIADERDAIDAPSGVKTILGPNAFKKLQDFDMVIRSAGVAPRKIVTSGKVWSATNEFFVKCPAQIIGVTGTKGKGTTCSLIASILNAAGKTVHLVGNIGTPALEVLPDIKPDDIVVYELSSFQLWDIEKSPHIAVVLGIEPDHLDMHAGFDEYIEAKANIVKHQTSDDIVIFNKKNQYSKQIAQRSPARKVEYPFAIDNFVASLKIPGKHNQANASAAIAATREYGVDENAIREGLSSFTGLPHRLKFVAEKKGVNYYDDSIATTPGSAIAAIDSFDAPKILLLGGREKGNDYADLIKKCADKQVRVMAYGENREQLKKLCDEANVECQVINGDMAVVVTTAASIAKQGDVVLLSPAAASFDMFNNYAERGDQFIAAVRNL